MIVTRSFMDQTWTDLHSPTKEELDSLILAQNLNPLLAKDLLTPTPKQHARSFDHSIYAVLHIPFFKHSELVNLEQEIDFIITPNSLLTTRYESIDALHHFAKQVEVSDILNKNNQNHLFFGLMKEVYDFFFDEVEYLKDWLRETEKNIFAGYEKEMVLSISVASRNVLSFKRIIYPHKAVLEQIALLAEENFDKDFKREIKLIVDEWERLMHEINNISSMLDELRETNNSLLSTKQNEIMRIFTILAFVTFPLSLIAAIFGMNTEHMPLVGLSFDFWAVIGLMLLISLAMFSYFKYKKWI